MVEQRRVGGKVLQYNANAIDNSFLNVDAQKATVGAIRGVEQQEPTQVRKYVLFEEERNHGGNHWR